MKRWVITWGVLGGVTAIAALGALVSTPDVQATCTHVLEFAKAAGELAGEEERALCHAHYTQERARGWLAWVGSAWCIRFADSFAEAGEC